MNGIKPIELNISIPKVELAITAPEVAINLGQYGDVAIDPPEYESFEGPYTVTPLTDQEQQFKTANKLMAQDMVVKKIPYSETSNTAGGTTVFIGKELE